MTPITFLVNKVFKKIPIINKFDTLFLHYLLVSVVSTTYDITLLYLLTEIVGWNYLVSATASYCIGTIVAYVGQRTITFKDQNKQIAKQFGVFVIVSTIGLIINLGILKLFVSAFGVHYLFGKIIAIGVGFFWNYSINKKITFKKEQK